MNILLYSQEILSEKVLLFQKVPPRAFEPYGFQYYVHFYDSVSHKSYTATNNGGNISKEFNIGDSLEVAYNVKQPEYAVVDKWFEINKQWIGALAMLVMTIFLLIGSFAKFSEDNDD